MCLIVWVCDEVLRQKWQKSEVLDFRPNLPPLEIFHPYFVCKSSFRVISMIKMVISDQSKPIKLILKNKKSKIQKSTICKFHVYYSQKRKLDKYTIHSKIKL